MLHRLIINKIIFIFIFISLIMGHSFFHAAHNRAKTREKFQDVAKKLIKILIFAGITYKLQRTVIRSQKSPLAQYYENHLKCIGTCFFFMTTKEIYAIHAVQKIELKLFKEIFSDFFSYDIWKIVLISLNIIGAADIFQLYFLSSQTALQIFIGLVPILIDRFIRKLLFNTLLEEHTKITNASSPEEANEMREQLKLFNEKLFLISQNSYPIPDESRSNTIIPFDSVLLYGLPGCGKSYVIENYLLNDNDKYTTHYIQIREHFLISRQWMNLILYIASINNPQERLIIHIDELDILLEKYENHFSALFATLRGMQEQCHCLSIILVGATNDIEKFPASNKISSRFDYRLYIPLPSKNLITKMISEDQQQFNKDFQQLTEEDKKTWIDTFITEKCSLRDLEYIIANYNKLFIEERSNIKNYIFEALQQKIDGRKKIDVQKN